MKRLLPGWLAAVVIAAPLAHAAPAKTLDVYFVDVEGGQATLIVTPAGQTLLVDAGFPGTGTFESQPGDPHAARDANRIVAAARQAGVTKIDYLLVTHFHADHVGGVPELAQLIPIGTFVDHGSVPPAAEQNVPGTLAAFAAYEKARGRAPHIVPDVGSRLPLEDLDLMFVSSAGTALAKPMAGAGERNAACGTSPVPAQEPNENPRSTGFVLQFGRFRFLDPGDLTGQPLFALACPDDVIGRVDVYLVAHHGGLDAADPATLAAFRPRVAIVDNGAMKGGTPEMLASLRQAGDTDTWQLHRSKAAAEKNVGDDHIANLDETTAHWIKLSARADGQFTVFNPRTKRTVLYDRSK